MAAVSLSPSPIPITSSVMSSKRVPLSANSNVANSPIRSTSKALAAASLAKHKLQKRAFASVQREEPYGQPPPAKKQMLEPGVGQTVKLPIKQKPVKGIVQRVSTRTDKDERTAQTAVSQKRSEEEADTVRVREWQNHQRQRFPNYVFYFESVPNDQRARIVKQLQQLGAREEKFFSINITHVITTRQIPDEKTARQQVDVSEDKHEATQTIDPSLLSRSRIDDAGLASVKKKLFENATTRRMPPPAPETVSRPPTNARSTDVLVRAREMSKKIWPLSKLQRMLEVLFEETSRSKVSEESNLAQLLDKERTCGPSDRDPTVVTKELTYFKGPYIYIYDISEKQKPIMVREYAKVTEKRHGDWPQFRPSTNGRCPFIEDYEHEGTYERQARAAKERVQKPAVAAAPKLNPPVAPPSKPVIGKRSLAQMEDDPTRRVIANTRRDLFDLAKAANPPTTDFNPQNAFTSRLAGKTGRFVAGEPVASGVQRSKATSAIQSQMISSATGVLASKAGISKEVHGLQRKVLQQSNPTSRNPTSQDMSSRRLAEMSIDTNAYQRSASAGRPVTRKLDQIIEDDTQKAPELKRTLSVPVPAAPSKPKRRDLKPGYCENCQDKFADFEEHIASRKHRKFAENNGNWTQLDALLSQLERTPRSAKYSSDVDEESPE